MSKPYKSIRVETATHIGETTVPVFTHGEWLQWGYRIEHRPLLGVKIKPVVRVKMWSRPLPIRDGRWW